MLTALSTFPAPWLKPREADASVPGPTCSSRQRLCFSEIWLLRACFSFSRLSRDSVDQSSFSSSHRAFSCGEGIVTAMSLGQAGPALQCGCYGDDGLPSRGSASRPDTGPLRRDREGIWAGISRGCFQGLVPLSLLLWKARL